MAKEKKAFETIPVGTSVTWHYRSAIGHGTVTGVYKWAPTRIIQCLLLNKQIIIQVNLKFCTILEKPFLKKNK